MRRAEVAQTSHVPWRNVLILTICQGLSTSCVFLIITISGVFGELYAPNATLITLPISALIFGNAIAIIPASYALSWLGRKHGFMLGATFSLLGCVVLAYGIKNAAFPIIIMGCAMIGLLSGFASYFRFAAVDGVGKNWAGRISSFVLFGGVIAAFLGPDSAVYAESLQLGTPFIGVPIILSIFIVLILFLLCFYSDGNRIEKRSLKLSALRLIFSSWHFPPIVITGMVGFSAMSLIMNATPLVMENHGFGLAHSSTVIRAHVLAMFIPSFFTGHLIDRYGARRIALVGFLFLLAGVIPAINGTEYSNFLFTLVLVGIGWNLTFIPATIMLTNYSTPNIRSEIEAANEFLIYTTNIIAAFAAGPIVMSMGWQGSWIFVAIIVSIGVAALVTRTQRNQMEDVNTGEI